MRSLIAAALCAVVLMSMPVSAQEGESSGLQGGLVNLHGVLTFPRGAFEKNLDRVGAGFGLEFGYAPTTLPLAAGLSGNFSWYDGKSTNVYVNTQNYKGRLPLDVSGKMMTLYLFLRLQPHTGVFQPFAEGLGGLNILWMNSSVEESYEEKGFSGENVLTDAGFGYGAGGGLEFRVYRGPNNSGQYTEAYISLRLRYLYGGKMEYLQAEAVSFDGNGKPFVRPEDRMSSEIEMMQIMVGITGRL